VYNGNFGYWAVAVEFTDYLWLKFFVLVGLAAIYGFWQGFTGKSKPPAQQDKAAAERENQTKS
jgi:hypothetical protein